jgi:hypothetical protein
MRSDKSTTGNFGDNFPRFGRARIGRQQNHRFGRAQQSTVGSVLWLADIGYLW